MSIYKKWELVPSNEVKSLFADIEEQYKTFDYQSLIHEQGRLQQALKSDKTYLPVLINIITVSAALLAYQQAVGEWLVKLGNASSFTPISWLLMVLIVAMFVLLIIDIHRNNTDKTEVSVRLHIVNAKLDSLKEEAQE